jgi:hypothetical protein
MKPTPKMIRTGAAMLRSFTPRAIDDEAVWKARAQRVFEATMDPRKSRNSPNELANLGGSCAAFP